MTKAATTTGDRWGQSEVTVTLTGEEWTALFADAARRKLSAMGVGVRKRASRKLGAQLVASADRFGEGR